MVNWRTRKYGAKFAPEKAGCRSNRRQRAAGGSRAAGGDRKKMLMYDVGSRNVYENNRNTGIMPDEKSDICVGLTCILQKSANFDG
jgi:hypothetical protein